MSKCFTISYSWQELATVIVQLSKTMNGTPVLAVSDDCRLTTCVVNTNIPSKTLADELIAQARTLVPKDFEAKTWNVKFYADSSAEVSFR